MTYTLPKRLNRVIAALVITVQIFFFPLAGYAEENTSAVSPTDTQPTQSVEATTDPTQQTVTQTDTTTQTGPQSPTGADAKTYTLNPDTGLWENDHYIWNPATGQTTPKDPQTYSYNPTTGMWDTTQWYFSPETGKYQPNTISSPVNPVTGAAKQNSAPVGNGAPTIAAAQPANGQNQTVNNSNASGIFNQFYDATISNKIGQLSKSGNASVQGNTNGGSALTGDAETLANILNMIQSSWGGLAGDDIATFVANIDGNVTGDLYVDPGALKSSSSNASLTVNTSQNAAISNDIHVAAATGNATVADNTQAGDATSGSARAVINLLNLINSAISSHQSFVGVLNINGNLNGDILLPPDVLQRIIAATGPQSQTTGSSQNTITANLTSTSNDTIRNTVTTDASTGNATVSGNTQGGNATTGNANSKVVVLNLTGKQVIAKDALLVFVNVLGNWVGLIMDAPAGTNAAALTGPDSNSNTNQNSNLAVTVDNTSNNLIDNTVSATAQSGDASVSHNTNGGNAKTGDASVGVNILNMTNSSFSVDDWFGVLFINVFGSWIGSFGVNTDAGTIHQPAAASSGTSGASSGGSISGAAAPKTFSFIPHANTVQQHKVANQGEVAGASDSTTPPTSTTNGNVTGSSATPSITAQHNSSNMLGVAGLVTFAGLLMLGGERLLSLVRLRMVP